MASTVWKGQLAFGLVSIPVRLVRAARAERVKLRQLYRPAEAATVAPPVLRSMPRSPELARPPGPMAAAPVVDLPVVEPVRRVYQPESGGEESQPVQPADLVKGYEYEKGQYVVLEDRDLRDIAPATSSEIEILEFVRFEEVDPIYLETSYYLQPDQAGEKAYALLFKALRKTGYAAVGNLTMHRRDHVLIVRSGQSGLIAHTLFYSDEVRAIEEFRTDTSAVASKELDLAVTLVNALAQPFEPAKFKNAFREKLLGLIESRTSAKQVATTEAPAASKVVNILEALQRTLAEMKPQQQRKPPAGEPRAHKRGRTARQ